jgi:hypothetical protein
MKKSIIYILLLFSISGCGIGAGTLGTFQVWKLDTNIDKVLSAFEAINESNLPDKWKKTSSNIQQNYEFMSTICIYFRESPEEMYFLSYNGNSKVTKISVRSVYDGKIWRTQNKCTDEENSRINNRFQQIIIKKLKNITNSSAEKVEY